MDILAALGLPGKRLSISILMNVGMRIDLSTEQHDSICIWNGSKSTQFDGYEELMGWSIS